MTKLARSINQPSKTLLPSLSPLDTVVPDSLSRDGRTSEVVIVKKFIQGSKYSKTPKSQLSTSPRPDNNPASIKGVTERLEREINREINIGESKRFGSKVFKVSKTPRAEEID
jgi:hypothetical protein